MCFALTLNVGGNYFCGFSLQQQQLIHIVVCNLTSTKLRTLTCCSFVCVLFVYSSLVCLPISVFFSTSECLSLSFPLCLSVCELGTFDIFLCFSSYVSFLSSVSKYLSECLSPCLLLFIISLHVFFSLSNFLFQVTLLLMCTLIHLCFSS